jgi:hypothetical protein
MSDFEVGGKKYRSGKMNAIQQFQVARRLAPILAAIPDAVKKINSGFEAMVPMLEIVSKMSDDEVTYVIGECMSVVNREDGAGWAKVWVKGASAPMYDDIDMMQMLTITTNVIMDNLLPFIGAVPQISKGQPAP